MLTAESAITRMRRDLTLGALVKGLLAAAFLAAFLVLPLAAPQVDQTVALVVLGIVWLALSFTSAKSSRLAADSPALISSGQFDEAERQIDQALRSFSMFRSVKLQSLHHLAILRHAQRRWRESALLSRALLGQRLGPLQALAKPSRLLLAEAMLELDDLPGAYEALSGLHAHRLSLSELLKLQSVQLDYECRAGAWDSVVDGLPQKVQLAELMPAGSAARAQAMMALAAERAGKSEWSDWLRRRAELLADPEKLAADRPVLAALWGDGARATGAAAERVDVHA